MFHINLGNTMKKQISTLHKQKQLTVNGKNEEKQITVYFKSTFARERPNLKQQDPN